MPPLENQRWELFCQAVARGETTSKAYQTAGFRPSRSNSARLRADERIEQRILELQQVSADACKITVESICAELDRAVELARAEGKPSALVSAAQLRAKLGGLLIDKAQVEVSTSGQFDGCSSIEGMASQMLDSMTNARWLPITPADRQQLADLIRAYWGAVEAFLHSIDRRPLQKEPVALITTGRTPANRAG
jgi:hypothetical protein